MYAQNIGRNVEPELPCFPRASAGGRARDSVIVTVNNLSSPQQRDLLKRTPVILLGFVTTDCYLTISGAYPIVECLTGHDCLAPTFRVRDGRS